MILSILDRITIGNIIPRKIDDVYSLNDLYLSKSIDAKIKFTSEELGRCGIVFENGLIKWAADAQKEIEFTESEIELIRKCFNDCIQKKHFTMEMLSTFDMFGGV